MTATNAVSVAILKRRYAGGVLPKAQFLEFPFYDAIAKDESWNGDDMQLALQGEDPQGIGIDVSTAQANLQQGDYRRFNIVRKEVFGIARIKGQALKTAKGDSALVDLWVNETDGIARALLKEHEIFAFGTGNGVLATVSSGAAGTTWTLSVAEDINNLALGQRVQLVSDTTLNPTTRVTVVSITAVNRAAGTVTVSGAVAAAANGDSIVRSGNQAAAGVPKVFTGMRQWLIGGATPGTLFGLDRNADPVRYASQALDATGLPMAEAIIDLEALITIQGKTPNKKLICNPRDMRQVKKTAYGKVQFTTAGGTAGIGFSDAKWAGDGGDIGTLMSPFCPKGNAFLKDMSTFKMYSAGPAPMPLNFDKSEFLRVSNDDAYEIRMGTYGDFGERLPVNSARLTNWGF